MKQKMRTHRIFCFFILLLSINNAFAQKDSTKLHFFEPAPTFNKGRTIALSSTLVGVYTGTMLGLNQLWYANAERSAFHFFDDSKEWQQVDKIGHFHTAYMESVWLTKLMRWTGTKPKKSALIGAVLGWSFQTSIEIFDGFSAKWGASWSDVGANTIGSALAYTQFYFWNEQRIRSKYSFHAVTHSDAQLQNRSNKLYGSSEIERLLKDYNGLVVWLSVNPSSFMKKKTKVDWLNIAVGYGASGMYGGFANEWKDEQGNLITRYDVERYRRFFLSLDVDWERISTKSPYLKTFFSIINVIKVPAPAMEFNTKGEIIFHPMFFLNWNVPIYLKK